MSPKRFSVRSTSKLEGASAIFIAHASTYMWSTRTAGWRKATSFTTVRQSRDVSSTLALSTDVTRFFRPAAALNATSAMRSTSPRE